MGSPGELQPCLSGESDEIVRLAEEQAVDHRLRNIWLSSSKTQDDFYQPKSTGWSKLTFPQGKDCGFVRDRHTQSTQRLVRAVEVCGRFRVIGFFQTHLGIQLVVFWDERRTRGMANARTGVWY